MKKIIISVESGADVPPAIAEEFGIKIVAMHVVKEGVDYFDDGSLPPQEIYDYYHETKKVPTTSGTNIDEYINHFKAIREEYPDSVIYQLAYSEVTSCTYKNCRIAMDDFEDIYLINSKRVSGGQCACAVKAAMLLQERGGVVDDYEAFAKELESWMDQVHVSFVPANLDFLKAGGRCSNAAYLGATLLNLHPMIELNDEGYLVAEKKYRGSMLKVVNNYVPEYIERYNFDRNEPFYILHCLGASDELLARMNQIAQEHGFKRIIDIPCGSVISCHGGIGAIGVAGISAQN